MGSKRRIKNQNAESGPTPELIGKIYDTILDPGLWGNVLADMGARLHASGLFLLHSDCVNQQSNVLESFGYLPETLVAYRDHWFQHDPGAALLQSAPMGTALATSQYISTRKWQSTEYQNEFSLPHHLSDQLGVRLFENSTRITYIGMARGLGDPDYSSADIAFLQQLVPHLRRALQVSRYCTELQNQLDSTAQLLDRLSQGVILLNADGRIVQANAKAESMIGAGSGLAALRGRLSASDPSESLRLQKLVHDAVETGSVGGTSAGGTMRLSGADGRQIRVMVSPLSTAQHGLGWATGKVCAMVLLQEQEPLTCLSEELLQLLYRLTPAEARLAVALAEGHSLSEVSELHAITRETARSQLKIVFNKTDTHRQAELVRLVLTGPWRTAQ